MKHDPIYVLIARQNKIKDSIKQRGAQPGDLRALADLAKELTRRSDPTITPRALQ